MCISRNLFDWLVALPGEAKDLGMDGLQEHFPCLGDALPAPFTYRGGLDLAQFRYSERAAKGVDDLACVVVHGAKLGGAKGQVNLQGKKSRNILG